MKRSLIYLKNRYQPISLLLISLTFLLSGLGFGLPYYSNFYVKPDETLLAIPALEFFGNYGDPKFYHYPAALTLIHSLVIHLAFYVSKLISTTDSQIIDDFFINTKYYWISIRFVSSLFALATIWLVYRITTKITDKNCAFFVSLLYCISPLPIREAHFAVTDTALTFGVALFLYYFIPLNKSILKTKSSIYLGIIIGISTGFKFSGLILLFVALIGTTTLFQISKFQKLRSGSIILFSTVITFVLLNPYLILNLNEIIAFSKNMTGALYHQNKGFNWTIFKAWTLLPGSFLSLYLIILSLLDSNSKKDHKFIPLCVLLAFLAPLVFSQHIPFRYYLPLSPPLAILMSIGLKKVFSYKKRTLLLTVNKTMLAGTIIFSALVSFNLILSLSLKDTRSLVWDYIKNNYSSNDEIVIFGPPETEPQISESILSIQRRIKYVYKIYGEKSGEIVSRLYKLQLLPNNNSNIPTYNVLRNPTLMEAKDAKIIIVPQINHPTFNLNLKAVEEFLNGKVILRKITIGNQKESIVEYLTIQDGVDAFFLDFKLASSISNPGPNFTIYQLQ